MISNHAFVPIERSRFSLPQPSFNYSVLFPCPAPSITVSIMPSQAAASGLHHPRDCSRVITKLLLSLNQPPLFPHISLHNSQQQLASNNNNFHYLMICLWYDTVYIWFGNVRVCGKKLVWTVNPAKVCQKLVVKPHNSCYKIVAFITNAFEIVLGDTLSYSMRENFEVSVEMCQGFKESKYQTKKSHCRTSLLLLRIYWLKFIGRQVSFYKSDGIRHVK